MAKSKRRIKKSIESYDKRIKEHQDKIDNHDNPDDEVVEYWKKQIATFQENKRKDKERLEKN